MTDLNESWWFNVDNNASTNRAINEFLRSTVAAQRRLRSSLDEQSRETKNLGERIARAERAILAVVALEDARELLAPYRAEHATRVFARSVLAGAFDGPVPVDVGDYWLAPAARAVAAWSSGGDGTADAAEARRRDPQRAELFVTVSAALAGRDVAVPATLLPPTTGDVTPTQRTLWTAAVRGRFGAAGRAAAIDALRAAVAAADPAEVHRLLGRRLPPLATRRPPGAQLEALRTWTEAASAPAASAAEPHAGDGAGAGTATDPLAAIAHRLVEEGSEAERPLLEAAANARQAIDDLLPSAGGPAAAPEADATPTLQWLMGDVVGDDAALRSVALTVLTPAIDRVAAALTEAAAEAPEPASLRVAEPAPPAEPAPGRHRYELLAIAAAAVCVVGVILGAVASPAWFVLSVAGGVLAGVLWHLSQDRASSGAT